MMAALNHFIARLKGHDRAATAVEFALVGPLFFLILMGFFDYSWQIYGKSVLQGAVGQAARYATLETYIENPSRLDDRVKAQVRNVFKDADVRFTRAAFDSYEQIGKPESYTDSNKNGKYDVGECFQDINGNGKWDAISEGKAGNGGADDIILYTATMKFRRTLPVWAMLNQPQEVTLSSSTILRNQPFNAGKELYTVVCK
ncbi:TadE/TadG family type IV pilus assembly protein [Sphingopyxis yananensis]|uniref:TadE/TadG family type IV pilus assembly protein n=1 Tax=Sphingopyxis yananensis TaxID=2886687 RepID=UPI001D0FBADE|nr:TadE/TadG family type IV pilus assembly protein [Sphingopyxis yananensis]MCC2601231.1 pilus assembly protein [Sphingopyxis yananensis]